MNHACRLRRWLAGGGGSPATHLNGERGDGEAWAAGAAADGMAGQPEEQRWLVDDGALLSGASVAARRGADVLIGTVFQPGIFRCTLSAVAAR